MTEYNHLIPKHKAPEKAWDHTYDFQEGDEPQNDEFDRGTACMVETIVHDFDGEPCPDPVDDTGLCAAGWATHTEWLPLTTQEIKDSQPSPFQVVGEVEARLEQPGLEGLPTVRLYSHTFPAPEIEGPGRYEPTHMGHYDPVLDTLGHRLGCATQGTFPWNAKHRKES